jgi:hypothetical protein
MGQIELLAEPISYQFYHASGISEQVVLRFYESFEKDHPLSSRRQDLWLEPTKDEKYFMSLDRETLLLSLKRYDWLAAFQLRQLVSQSTNTLLQCSIPRSRFGVIIPQLEKAFPSHDSLSFITSFWKRCLDNLSSNRVFVEFLVFVPKTSFSF